MPKVSRRDFLKFMAAGGIVAAGGFIGLSSLTSKSNRREASAQTTEPAWVYGSDTIGHAVHVALLPDGKVFYLGGSGWHIGEWKTSTFQAGIYDPATDTHEVLDHPVGEDLFCCSHVPLENGNILLAGGTLNYRSLSPNTRYWGLKATYEYNWQEKRFEIRPDMAHGRWYPTMVTLEDGKVLTVEGYDEWGYHNLLTEIYDPDTGAWSISYDPVADKTYTVGCGTDGCLNPNIGATGPTYGGTDMGVAPNGMGLYPRMHLMPNGIVALVGQGGTRRTWEPATGRWRGAGSTTKRSYGTSVLLPLNNTPEERGAILACGGSSTSTQIAVASAEIIRPTSSGLSLSSTAIDPMRYPRRHCNPVILPNGKIMIFGGNEEKMNTATAIKHPELFDPETETWEQTDLPAHELPRAYHSGAILLQDGRVWTMGTSYNSKSYETQTEIYRPPYYFATRPEITDAPPIWEYGGTITIQTPDAGNIEKVSLVKVSSTTHHYNTDQRLIWLLVQDNLTTESSITVKAPINSRLAPAGYYMLHIINDQDVPSEGAMISVRFPAAQQIFYDVSSPGDSFMTLRSGSDLRAGEEALSGSALIGKQLKRWTVYLKKVSNPSGPITAHIRKKIGDEIVASFSETIEASTLTTSYMPYEFTMATPYTIEVNDRILVEYGGASGVRVDAWDIEKFDGNKTRRVKYTGTYSGTFMNDKDTSGIMSSE